MSEWDARRLMCLIHGPESSAIFHPERPRKQRYSLFISGSSYSGIHDMIQIGCGKDWENAFADMWKRDHDAHCEEVKREVEAE